MKRTFTALFIIILLLPTFTADVSDGSDYSLLRLSAVLPTGQFEGVAVTNYGNDDINLKDYFLSDGEGTVKFTEDIILKGSETVFILKAEPESWACIENYVIHGEKGVTAKNFTLSDSGDDIMLMKGEVVIDTFVYGNVTATEGWNGDSFQKIAKKHFASRISIIDTDSAKDWSVVIPGRSDFRMPEGFEAEVTPFVFPESKGIPLKNALYEAESTIDISVYLLTDSDVVSSLIHAMNGKVAVRILLEGSPAGGISATERTAMSTLKSWGADIRFISSEDGYKRYDYLHSKYAVIDGNKVIVTSENWTESSFTSNRGWGAVIESEGYAEYMESVFESDFSGTYDIVKFEDLYPKEKKGSYGKYIPSKTEFESYNATVTPVLSPDFSYDAMRDFMQSAEIRLYSEQLEVEYEWIDGEDNPIQWMISSEADSRLLIDVTFDSDEDADEKDGYGIRDTLKEYDSVAVRTSLMDNMLHNKGIIADDRVWIGSVNWSDTSLNGNREVAVIVDSKEIADLYAEYFITDWGTESADDVVIDVKITGNMTEGNTFMIDASQSFAPESAVYEWDIDGDGYIDRSGKRIALNLSAGTYDIVLRVTDGNDAYQHTETVTVTGGMADINFIPLKYIPIIVLCVAVLAVNIIRRRKCRKDDSKRIQTGGRR